MRTTLLLAALLIPNIAQAQSYKPMNPDLTQSYVVSTEQQNRDQQDRYIQFESQRSQSDYEANRQMGKSQYLRDNPSEYSPYNQLHK